ncbi:MAG: NUDIX hydrolase [Spirulinaceae cyanobacterium]
MSEPRVSVAVAVLYCEGKFLMQLRDDLPGILYPGCWGFFGGHLEVGETPLEGVKRELLEEISYTPPSLSLFDRCIEAEVIRYIYHAPLTVSKEQLVLGEGWDLDLVTIEDIHRGNCYSKKAEQVRPIGLPHQRILLNFIETSNLFRES